MKTTNFTKHLKEKKKKKTIRKLIRYYKIYEIYTFKTWEEQFPLLTLVCTLSTTVTDKKIPMSSTDSAANLIFFFVPYIL